MIDGINLPEDEKTISDQKARENKKVRLLDVINVIKDNFNFQYNQLEKRTAEEQVIIGSLINSLELEIKKDLKELDEQTDNEPKP